MSHARFARLAPKKERGFAAREPNAFPPLRDIPGEAHPPSLEAPQASKGLLDTPSRFQALEL
jgi:hypothetical protein